MSNRRKDLQLGQGAIEIANLVKISFTEFLIGKSVISASMPITRIHPNVLSVWRSAYELEVPVERRETYGRDEILLEAGPGDSPDLLLQASGELSGSPAEFTIEASAEADKLPTFNMTAYNGGPMLPDGWYADDPIIIDLAGMNTAQSVPIDSGHAEDVGHSTTVEKTPGNQKLKARGVLSAYSKDPAAQDNSAASARRIVRMGAAGFPFQASISPSCVRAKIDFIKAGEKVNVNGRSFAGPVYVARESTLKKIAILSLGADSTTSTTVAASLQKGKVMEPEFVAWLKAQGFQDDPTQLSPAAIVLMKAQWKKAVVIEPPVDPAIAIRAAAAAELERIGAINLLCAAHPGVQMEIDNPATPGQKVSIQVHAIANGWNKTETELAILRNTRSAPTIIVHGQDRDCTRDTLEGAIMLRAGVALDNPHFTSPQAVAMGLPAWLRTNLNADQRQRTMEAAHSFAGLSLIDIARECVRLDGHTVPHGRDALLRAAFSGGTLTNIFTTNVNTIVLARYMESGDTTGDWVRVTDVADFKSNERPRLEKGGGGLQKLGRGGEADHRKFSDVGESYKIARYAEQFQIDEQDMIDDTFNAFDNIAPDMADDAARLRPDMVYAHLMSNPTLATTGRALFNATDANLATTTSLTGANLKAAITAMNLIRENSVNIDVTPTHFIGPPTLDFLVRQLLNSVILVGNTTADAPIGNVNTLQGLLKPVMEKRLENGVIDPASGTDKTSYSGSSSTWYTASNRVQTIEVAYLRGTGRAPVVRSFNLTQGLWGIGFDIKLDIGCKAMDWRGLRKHTA